MKSRLKQSKTRKDMTPKFCEKHKLHFYQECPHCFLETTDAKTLQDW